MEAPRKIITVSAFTAKNDSEKQLAYADEGFMEDVDEDFGDSSSFHARLSSPGMPLTSSDASMG